MTLTQNKQEKRISSLRKAISPMMQYDESENMLFDLKKTQIQNEAKYRLDDLDIRKKELQNRNAERNANNMLAIAQAKKI